MAGSDARLAKSHESAGVTELSPTWFFAEGATGPFFDLFLLIGNPGDQPAIVQATYLLPDGSTVVKQYDVGARSRFNIWVDLEGPQLTDTAVSTTLTSTSCARSCSACVPPSRSSAPPMSTPPCAAWPSCWWTHSRRSSASAASST